MMNPYESLKSDEKKVQTTRNGLVSRYNYLCRAVRFHIYCNPFDGVSETMREVRHKPCLILNQDYRPLLVISWKRALCLEIIGKEMPGEGIRVVSYYEDDYVTSAGGEPFPLPAVAVTTRFIKRRRKVALKKRNLLVRDNRSCQYCGNAVKPGQSTIDHVVPKSHFDDPVKAHTWENTVIACWRCNSSKGDKTPKQANMRLLTVPKEPDHGSFYTGMSSWASMPEEWKDYVTV